MADPAGDGDLVVGFGDAESVLREFAEMRAAPGGATVVGDDHDVAALREHLMKEVAARRPCVVDLWDCGSAVRIDQHWVLARAVEAWWYDTVGVEHRGTAGGGNFEELCRGEFQGIDA